jgi:hypothetical protein
MKRRQMSGKKKDWHISAHTHTHKMYKKKNKIATTITIREEDKHVNRSEKENKLYFFGLWRYFFNCLTLAFGITTWSSSI